VANNQRHDQTESLSFTVQNAATPGYNTPRPNPRCKVTDPTANCSRCEKPLVRPGRSFAWGSFATATPGELFHARCLAGRNSSRKVRPLARGPVFKASRRSACEACGRSIHPGELACLAVG
jgi:hypothetical protein